MIDNESIAWHYAHACDKHPQFADLIDWHWNGAQAIRELANCRRVLRENAVGTGSCTARNVLNCEIAEIFDAYHKGYREAAIEECYDAVAVLLRMVEMIKDELVNAEDAK